MIADTTQISSLLMLNNRRTKSIEKYDQVIDIKVLFDNIPSATISNHYTPLIFLQTVTVNCSFTIHISSLLSTDYT